MVTASKAMNVKELSDKLLSLYSEKDQEEINNAFLYAKNGHQGQKRKSGEEYITHPLHVAIYLAELNFDIDTIKAALLHDLVDGVTKLDKIKYNSREEAKADAIRKMVIAMSKDIRVLILKLADRLHNIETIEFHKKWTQEKIANETLYVYAPLAHRLGLQTIKHKLEDISFEILYDKQNNEIKDLLKQSNPNRSKQIEESTKIIKTLLDDNSLSAEVYGRPKHNYSIYKKIVNNGMSFGEINDLIGIRIITDDVKNCYTILGLIHANFQPVLGRFKDFISMPKFNLYQSLHTTVLTETGSKMEIQIRTHDMHYRAEFGVAAHWKYKEKPSDDLTKWTNELSTMSNEYPDPNEFLQHMKLDLYENEVFCLTPSGDVISLPSGSTPVDFAFAIHTQVGEKLIGAKINGKLANLSSILKTGDTVEILTSNDKDKGPSRDWLNIVKTSRARSKIKQWYQKQLKNEDIQKGKTILNSWLDTNDEILESYSKDQLLDELLKEIKLPNIESLYMNLANGNTGINSIGNKLRKIAFPEEINTDEDLYSAETTQESKSSLVIVEGYDDIQVRMAKCCVPVPGDDILGFVTITSGISIHRSDCLNVKIDSKKGERIIDVSWAFESNTGIIIWLEIEAIDRPYLLRDATIAISDNGGNILVAKSVTSSKRIVSLLFQIEISDNKQLEEIIRDAKNIESVFEASRIFPGKN